MLLSAVGLGPKSFKNVYIWCEMAHQFSASTALAEDWGAVTNTTWAAPNTVIPVPGRPDALFWPM